MFISLIFTINFVDEFKTFLNRVCGIVFEWLNCGLYIKLDGKLVEESTDRTMVNWNTR